MKQIIINGNKKLTGKIKISGAKNSAVALLPAAILSDEKCTIYNVPDISDTHDLIAILESLNCKTKYGDDVLELDCSEIKNCLIEEELSKKLRASYYFMGALLSKFKKVEMYFPGGCNIGARPINLHLKGFEMMGAKIDIDGDKYTIIADELKGARIYLDFASVGATINLMIAACKAKGKTVISNAAKEPEIVNIASFLNNMGAKITGAGTSEIKIIGVDYLSSGIIEVIPDRIEAGTYVIAGSLMGKDLVIESVISEHIESLLSKLLDMGVNLEISGNNIIVNSKEKLEPVNIKTLVYPGFPTDLAQPMSVVLTQATGTSVLEETIWENRMGHIKYLNKMGANINATNTRAIVIGKTKLKGQEVVATDLRAGAAMIVAGLVAEGTTTINNVEHILRGYENIVNKLKDVGASIELIDK